MITAVRNDVVADCSPLSQACIKALTDKMEEKRKFASIEIEKMTVEFSMSNNLTMINRLIIVLGGTFCLSPNPNARKGGLLGLAAVMVGFKNGSLVAPPQEMVEEVVRPILTCFLDSDPRVRYYACESLYNVTKVAKSSILPFFESIFDNMAKIVADADIGIRSGAELLDRLLKDIIVQQQSADVEALVPKFEEYIYTKNAFTKMFVISWVRLLESKIDLLSHLPQLLDGIFSCLYDSTVEIRASTLNLLSEFLNKIVVCPTEKIDIKALVSILLKHIRNEKEDLAQYTAIAWLRQFVGIIDDQDILKLSPDILGAILPCLAFQTIDDSTTYNREALEQNSGSQTNNLNRSNICEISALVNSLLIEQVTRVLGDRKNSVSAESNSNDIEPILLVLIRELQKQDHPVIKLAVLDWLKKIKKAEPDLILPTTSHNKLFQALLDILSDRSDAVVKNALRVVADMFCSDLTDEQQLSIDNLDEITTTTKDEETETDKRKSQVKTQSILQKGPSNSAKKVAIASGDSQGIQHSFTNVSRFIQSLYKTFRDKDVVFEDRGTFIIINLCSMIKPNMIYRSFAEILKDEKNDLKFAYNLVQKLNQILLTTQHLYGLRSRLSNDDDNEMTILFHSLFYAWCHSPIAALTLCLLTNNYRHASEIVTALSQIDINMDLLTQIDWVVQLIESPVFAYLRMRLLDVNNSPHLLQSLYGLLMILPQSEAYKRLGHRLDQVSKYMFAQAQFKTASPTVHKPSLSGSKDLKKTNPESLMKHFYNVQNQHTKQIRSSECDD